MIKVIGGALYQWDTGRSLEIIPGENLKVDEVHFKNPHGETAYVVKPKEVDGKITAPIPNILLQETNMLRVYATMCSEEGEQTIFDNTFGIIARQRPSDYLYEETEIFTIKEAVKNAFREAKENGEFADLLKAKAKIGEVTLLASKWVGENNLYSQVVEIEGVTEYSQVDLTPDVQQLAIFYNKDITFVTENEDGVVTVYVIGQKPENDYTIQVTITEVNV